MSPDSIPPSHDTVGRGACLCRKVQYELDGEPFRFIVCHCADCKKASGSAFMANMLFKTDQVRVTHGEDALSAYSDAVTESGTRLSRSFCSNCGSPLFVTNDKLSGMTVVTSGSIESGADAWVPTHEIFCRNKKGWVPVIEGVEVFDLMC